MFTLKTFLCYYLTYVTGQFHTNFVVNRIESCGTNKGPINLRFINVTKDKGGQYLNFDIITRIPVDDNVGVRFLIEHPLTGKTFVELFTIRSKSACKTANQYMGEFWYDMERAALISVGVCPILAGHYHVHNHLLDFRKITLQTFLFGKLRFTMTWVDNKITANIFLCIIIDVDNVLNLY